MEARCSHRPETQALALTHPTTEPRPKGKRTRTFDPDLVERSVLEAAMATLHEWRAKAGWPAKGWRADTAGHGEALLRALRGPEQLSVGEVLDAVKATVWSDSTVDPSIDAKAAKLAAGEHAHLTRIFGPTKAGKRQRCVERWVEEGRPEPSTKGRKRLAETPTAVDDKELKPAERRVYQRWSHLGPRRAANEVRRFRVHGESA